MKTLKLYVVGKTALSQRAFRNLQRICKEDLGGDYEVVVIDIREDPRLAEENRIIATPVVIKELPSPMRRVIGDFCEKEKVLLGLELVNVDTEAEEKERIEA